MTEKPIQYIFVPGLLDNLKSWQRDFGFQPSAPQLVKQLSRLSQSTSVKQGYLASAYALLQGGSNDQLSHAQACYQMEFGEQAETDVLCAHPIELEAGMSDITIGQAVIDDLDAQQNQLLLDELNQHFSEDGWQFQVSEQGSWFLLLPKGERPETTIPVEQVLGQSLRNVTDGIDKEKEALWNRQLTELQMLLYNSTANQLRENNRQRVVSSFWLWDINQSSIKSGAHKGFEPEFIIGGGYSGQVLANHYGLDWFDFETDTDCYDSQQSSGLYLFTNLVEPASFNDLDQWQQQLALLESFLAKQLDNQSTHTIIDTCIGYQWQSGKNNGLAIIRKLFGRAKKSLLDFL